MVKRQIQIIALIFVISATFAIQAEAWNIFPNLGDERAGTASMQFLKLGAGARAAAMGSSVVAFGEDAFNLYWNPAGIVWGEKKQLALAHNMWVVDISYNFVGFSYKLNEDRAVGVSLIHLGTPDMNVTDEYHPYGTGEKFGFADIAVGLTACQRLTDYFSFGATVKYAQENIENLSMKGVLLDLGTYYQTNFHRTRFAVTLTNFGQQMNPGGSYTYVNPAGEIITKDYQSFSPPTVFRLAMAADIKSTESNRWQASLQLDHPTDNAESFSLGTEYDWRKIVFLRGGYRLNNDTQSYSFGAGLNLQVINGQIDYALSTIGDLGYANTFSFHWSF